MQNVLIDVSASLSLRKKELLGALLEQHKEKIFAHKPYKVFYNGRTYQVSLSCNLIPYTTANGIPHWEIIPINPEFVGKGKFAEVYRSLGSVKISTTKGGVRTIVFSKASHLIKIMQTKSRVVTFDQLLQELKITKLAGVAKGGYIIEGSQIIMIMNDLGVTWNQINFNELSLSELMYRFAGAFSSLFALSGKGIIHNDISCGNLFYFDKTGRVCLADFGASHTLTDSRDRHCGTPFYMAPEGMIEFRTTKTDIFALAGIVLSILTDRQIEDFCLDRGMTLATFLYGQEGADIREFAAEATKPKAQRMPNIVSSDVLDKVLALQFAKEFIAYCKEDLFLSSLKSECSIEEVNEVAKTLLQCLSENPADRLNPYDVEKVFSSLALKLFAREMGITDMQLDQRYEKHYSELLNVLHLLKSHKLIGAENFITIFGKLTNPNVLPNLNSIMKMIVMATQKYSDKKFTDCEDKLRGFSHTAKENHENSANEMTERFAINCKFTMFKPGSQLTDLFRAIWSSCETLYQSRQSFIPAVPV